MNDWWFLCHAKHLSSPKKRCGSGRMINFGLYPYVCSCTKIPILLGLDEVMVQSLFGVLIKISYTACLMEKCCGFYVVEQMKPQKILKNSIMSCATFYVIWQVDIWNGRMKDWRSWTRKCTVLIFPVATARACLEFWQKLVAGGSFW